MIPVRFTQILRCSRFSSCTGLLGVLFLALLVRLVAVLTLSTPNTEPSFQGSIAQQILNNGRLYYTLLDYDGHGVALNRPPLFGALLALVTWLFKSMYWGNVVLQTLIALGCVALTYSVTQVVFKDRRVATISCGILAVYPYYVVNAVSMTDRGLQTFLLLVVVLSLLSFDQRLSLRYSLVAGVFCGLEILTRSLTVLALPILMIWICLPTQKRYLRLVFCGLTFLVTATTVAPWAFYSSRA